MDYNGRAGTLFNHNKRAGKIMPAKSFIGAIEHAARGWYATVLRGEVSDANVRAYLNAASQIADVWQQRMTALLPR
jgi:hypothetical protein